MSFTIMFALLASLILIVVFFAGYRMKGLKSALFITGTVFIVLAVMLVIAMGLIVSAMPN